MSYSKSKTSRSSDNNKPTAVCAWEVLGHGEVQAEKCPGVDAHDEIQQATAPKRLGKV